MQVSQGAKMEIFSRSVPNTNWDHKSKPLIFQAISWHAQDFDYAQIDDELDRKIDNYRYIIKVFGASLDGKTVSLTIKDFTPYFYVKLPQNWDSRSLEGFHAVLQNIIGERSLHALLEMKTIKKMDFWGFTNFEKFRFIRLKFQNQRTMRKVVRQLEEGLVIKSKTGDVPLKFEAYDKALHKDAPYKLELYESNIDPYIRFMHINNLEPCGWIQLDAACYSCQTEILQSTCNLDVETIWQRVTPYQCDDTAPFLIASFDIECTSNTGDFPVPIKNYRKLACEIYDLHEKLTQQCQPQYVKCDSIINAISYALGLPIEDDDSKNQLYKSMITKVTPKQKKLTPTAISNINKAIKQSVDEINDMLDGKIYINREKPNRDKRITWLSRKLSNKTSLNLPQLEGDPVIAIGTTFHRYGETQCCFKHIVTLGPSDPIDGVTVESYNTEKEMLMAWVKLIQKTNPDVITGYNIFGFDFSNMYDRAIELGIARKKSYGQFQNGTPSPFMMLSRLLMSECDFKEQRLSSSALGDNFLKFIDMPGRVLIDCMKVVQRDHKLDSYKLDLVAYHFLKQNKHDVSPKDINRLQMGTPAERKVIADYCVQDCTLCNHLIMKLEIIANNMGMSNVCLVPLSFIFMRGQGIKIFSLVLKECKDQGFLIPVKKPQNSGGTNNLPPWLRNNNAPKPEEELLTTEEMEADLPVFNKAKEDSDSDDEAEDSYEGAIVLEPKEGIYIDDPVSVLDYASLYPSSMISENLSHDCIVIDPKYDNLPGVEYLDISYDLYEGKGDKKVKNGVRTCRFVQLPNNKKGVIPDILQKLLKARKTTRKKMEWQLVELQDGTKHIGMFINDDAKGDFVDSHGNKHNITSDQITSQSDYFNEFQKAVLDGLQLAYKITANSLYGQIGAKTSQIYLKDIAACTTATGRKMIMMAKEFLEKNYNANVVYGDSVASYTPILIRIQSTGEIRYETIEDIAPKYGGNKWIPCIEQGKQDKEACELTGIDTWTDEGWTTLYRVIRHVLVPTKKMIRVLTNTGLVDVTDDHSLCKPDGSRISPKSLNIGDKLLHRNLPNNNKTSTIEDLAIALDVDIETIIGACVFTAYFTNQLKAAKCFAIASSAGYHVRVENETFMKKTSYKLICSTIAFPEDPDTIVSMTPIDYQGFVYDFTTCNHHFQSGIGRLINGNTDSIFIIFPDTPYESEVHVPCPKGPNKGQLKIMPSINTAIKASHEFKKLIKQPHDLEYEKTFWPFILLSKKRYVGNLYEKDDKKYKQKSMGIVLKRRDNAQIVKQVYGGVIDIILTKQNILDSIAFMQQRLNDLIDGKSPLEDLVISKQLRSEYKDPTRIAHKVLAERIGERDPGNKPQTNDRIPYIYIQTPPQEKGKKLLQGEKIESPDFIKANNLKPDYGFYITNQLMKPLLQVFAIVLDQIPGSTINKESYPTIYQTLLAEAEGNERKAKAKLETLKEKEVARLLFDPILERLVPPEDKERKKRVSRTKTILDYYKHVK